MNDTETETAARREIPVPEAVIAELHRLRAEMDARFARRAAGEPDPAPDPGAPLILVYDEAHDLFHLPVDARFRAQVAEILNQGAQVNMRPVPAVASLPDSSPVLGRVRAAADAMRVRIERERAEADARRRAEAEAAHSRESAETAAAAELAWSNLFRPDDEGPALAWQGYPSSREHPGGTGPCAVAHLGEGVFVLYEPGHRATHLYTLAPCVCGPDRYRSDTVRSAAGLSLLLDDILGEFPECGQTCTAGERW